MKHAKIENGEIVGIFDNLNSIQIPTTYNIETVTGQDEEGNDILHVEEVQGTATITGFQNLSAEEKAEYGYLEVNESVPETPPYNTFTDNGYKIEDGQVVRDIIFTPISDEVIMDQVRHTRNKLLVESDVWLLSLDLPDSTIPNKETVRAGVVTYRQALRDITTSEEDPRDIVFPNLPEGLGL